MDVAPFAILAFIALFATALGWATSGHTGSVTTATPEEQVGKTS